MLAWLERHQFLMLAVAGLLILGGLTANEVLDAGQPEPLVFRAAEVTPDAPIRVHVAGAVTAPGVYQMQGGDRVEDALAAAGGARSEADLDAVNLARRLRDAEQILFPGTSGPDTSAVTLAEGEPFDLNLATREELMALPGIGEAYSRRIIDSRTVDGPYQSVDEVLARGLVPASTLEGIRELVIVSQP